MTKKQRKLNYWEKRSVNHEIKVFDGLNKPEKKIQRAYQRAQNYLTSEVKQIYNRYLNQSDFSEEQVKKIMNTSVGPEKIVEFQSIVKTVQDKEIKKQMQDYVTGLAVKSRITRLEDLKAKSYLVSKQVADVQLRASTDYYIDVINDGYNQAAAEGIIGQTDKAYSVYDDGKYPTYTIKDGKPQIEIIDWKTQKVAHTIDLERDKPIQEFKELSTKYVKNILESDWKGSNYSKRIWSDTDLLAKTLEELFTVEAMTGMSERDMANKLMNQFNVSAYVAKRLVRTEANYMAGQAKLKGWKEHGVEKYVIVAVLDLRTSSICQEKDSKIYLVSEAICNGKDGTYPPFHPWCRTVVRAYFGEKSLQGNRTAIDPVTGKRFKILQSDSYKAWEKMLIDKHGQKELDIVKEQVKNFNSDLTQYRKYQKMLGKENTPDSFDKFQKIKYNKESEWTDLKSEYQLYSKASKETDWRSEIDGLSKDTESLLNETHRDLFKRSKEQSTEKLYLINKQQSSVEYSLEGENDNVLFDQSLIDKLKNAPENTFILSHNHPGKYPSSFSSADIRTLFDYKSIQTLTIETSGADRYVIDRKDAKLGKMKKLLFANNYQNEISKMIAKHGEKDELWPTITHDVNTKLADKYNYHYKKVK